MVRRDGRPTPVAGEDHPYSRYHGESLNGGRQIWGSRFASGEQKVRSAKALHYMHGYGNVMHMRTTLIINEALLSKAQELTGLREKTAVVHAGLEALISRENARRLAALGGSERQLRPIFRRRSKAFR